MESLDRWQRRHPVPAAAWGVQKKFGDDNAGLWVLALSWYGFTAIFPLLLGVVTILGYIGQASLGSHVVSTLQHFPIIGQDLQVGGGGQSLHGSVFGLVVGLVGLFYGAQGVTLTAEQTMCEVWNVPKFRRPGFIPRLGRSLGGLVVISLATLINAFGSGYATGTGRAWAIRVPVIAALLMFNVGAYLLTFRILTPRGIRTRALLPGAIFGGAAFTLLITVGTSLVEHMLRNNSNTYGTFGTVIGIVAFLGLLAKLTVFGAELNPVLDRRLYPRQFIVGEPTAADKQVWRDVVHQERRRDDQRIGVGFGEGAAAEAATDANNHGDPGNQARLESSDRTDAVSERTS